MGTVRADAKGRIVIPGAKPGDVIDVQQQGDERYVFQKECLEAMSRSPLSVTLLWEELRRFTREP